MLYRLCYSIVKSDVLILSIVKFFRERYNKEKGIRVMRNVFTDNCGDNVHFFCFDRSVFTDYFGNRA